METPTWFEGGQLYREARVTMNIKFRHVGIIGCLYVAVSLAAPERIGLEMFVGQWSCSGQFANGAPIAGEIAVKIDTLSGALIVHHDDAKPGAYHSLEVWSAGKTGAGFKASISDGFSGMRWFESKGWQGDTLTWVRADGTAGSEQFAYTLTAAGDLQIIWSVMRDGTMKVGDSLSCKRLRI
jgi:hypothetical protein